MMAGIEDYRDPDEVAAVYADARRLMPVLAAARSAIASLTLSMRLGEDPATVEILTNRMWNILRGLDCDDRLKAIVQLMEPAAFAAADELIASIDGGL